MKRLFCVVLFCVFAILVVNAQTRGRKYTEFQYEKMREEGVCPSKIVSLEGDTFLGFLKIMDLPSPRQLGAGVTKGTVYAQPWVQTHFGTKVKFISVYDFNSKKIKSKMYKYYTPKKIKGYVYDYEGDNLHFERHYVKTKNSRYRGYSFLRMEDTLSNGDVQCVYIYPLVTNQDSELSEEEVELLTTIHAAVYSPSEDKVYLVEEEDPSEFYVNRSIELVKRWNSGYYHNLWKDELERMDSKKTGRERRERFLRQAIWTDYLKEEESK